MLSLPREINNTSELKQYDCRHINLEDARKYIESIMKQRQLIIDRHIGHKNDYQMMKIIDHLKVNLDAAGRNDLAMSRYFIINEEEIRSLIPGSYPNKRFEDLISLRDQAKEIMNRQQPSI
jgi:hypothetical protein